MLKAPKLIDLIRKHGVKVSSTEPTTGEKVWFKTNNQLLDYNNISQAAIDVGFVVDANGNISDTSPTGDNRIIEYYRSNYFFELEAGTYSITQFFSTKATSANVVIALYKDDGTQIFFDTTRNVDRTDNTFTLNQKTKLGLLFKIYDGVCKVMLCSGTSAMQFEPYVEKEIYCKNGNGSYDKFYGDEVAERLQNATASNTYISNVERNIVTKYGKIITFSFTFTATSKTLDYTSVLFSGLPRPKDLVRFLALNTNTSKILRMQINLDGSISNAYSAAESLPINNQVIEGYVTYICE